ncbi:MAG: flagellar biosynthetic protein FliO [Desulfamplus sp.]|nr:flagellar biosynthetic protein FliO [Desulfamplus sp.]MBF0241552.1 flagellar biosynthetic protein FliO [Desulfamplus sp.]MBF0389582.1 flagellar biosynthetic protein FliO [Desulfamplus sp.]
MEHSTDIWAAFFKTGGVLLFVILFLVSILYLLKRFSHLRIINSRHDHIKILALHHFSPREKVVLMEVMGKTLLIGVTSQNIQTIATIKDNQSVSYKDTLTEKGDLTNGS